MDKITAVRAALQKWSRTPFVWGQSDCMLSVADYLRDAVGVDCGGRFRGAYSTRLGCARVSGFLRDPVKPFADCVAEIPLAVTECPAYGDVGVVEFSGIAAGAICLGDKWASRADVGVVIATPSKILKAWAV